MLLHLCKIIQRFAKVTRENEYMYVEWMRFLAFPRFVFRMKRQGRTLVASSFVREVHREWTRTDDEQTFVYCTFANNKRGWVAKESFASTRPDLSSAIETGRWSKMREGGRMKAKPLTNESNWFQIVHPDEPNQPVHAHAPPVESHDWMGLFKECEQRVCQLELSYSMLLSYINMQTSRPTTHSGDATIDSTSHSDSDHAVRLVSDAESTSGFDLEEFVRQHSFSEVSNIDSDAGNQ